MLTCLLVEVIAKSDSSHLNEQPNNGMIYININIYNIYHENGSFNLDWFSHYRHSLSVDNLPASCLPVIGSTTELRTPFLARRRTHI